MWYYFSNTGIPESDIQVFGFFYRSHPSVNNFPSFSGAKWLSEFYEKQCKVSLTI